MVNEFQESGAKAASKEAPLVIEDQWRVKPDVTASAKADTTAHAAPKSEKPLVLKRDELASLDSLLKPPSTDAADARMLLSQRTWQEMKPIAALPAPSPLEEVVQDGVLKLHKDGSQLWGLRFGKVSGQDVPADGSYGQSSFLNKEQNANMRSTRGQSLYLQYQRKF